MRTSMASVRQLFAVISQGNSRSGFHTSCQKLLRKIRGVSGSVETQAKTNDEISNGEFPSELLRAEVNGSSSSLPPDLQGQESSQSRRFRVPPVSIDATKGDRRESWAEMSDDKDDIKGQDVPRYTKAGPDDKRLGRATMLAKSRKYREQSGKIILEGRRLITDALESGARADTIFFSQVSNIEGLPLAGSRVNLVKVAYKDISLWSDVSTPQGIVGVFQRPKHENLNLDQTSTDHLPVSLICDNIRDPGNLGTILRSAAAAACQKILLTKGCVDVWEPKVLRSGAGAHFRVPIISNIPWNSLPNYLSPNRSVHIADCNYVHNDNSQTQSSHGASENQSEYAQNEYDNDDDISADHSKVMDETNAATDVRTVPYFSVNWTQGDYALVIGGETEGLSREAKELCTETGGRRIFIPMSMGIDSLNAAMATSVILFEAKRQLLTANKSH
eukprot:XP_782724.3 PREDICTED: rRNA methyltransferase 3, mitochondrial [Strongylocentrotus purpuratus]